MKKRGTILFKIKYLENKQIEKSLSRFFPTTLNFKLLQEVLTFNNICLSLSSPKINLEMNFLNLKIQSFENVSYS